MIYDYTEKGISAIQKADFSRGEGEYEIHHLIELCPLLVLPDFLSTKKEQFEVFHELNLGSMESADFVIAWEDGTTLIIEAKLSTNGEIRRRIVGQLFDYASKLKKLPPLTLIEAMKNNKSTPKEFLGNKAFLDKVGNPLYLAVVSDRITGGLTRIMGWLAADGKKCQHQIYGVEINKYACAGKYFVEQRFILPEELVFGIQGAKLTDRDLLTRIQEEYGPDAEEIGKFLRSIPQGWKKENRSATITVSYTKPHDTKFSLSVYFNLEQLAIWGRNSEYMAVTGVIKALFPRATFFPEKQTRSDLFAYTKISYEGITEEKLRNLFAEITRLMTRK